MDYYQKMDWHQRGEILQQQAFIWLPPQRS
jgi:hypothetical protein